MKVHDWKVLCVIFTECHLHLLSLRRSCIFISVYSDHNIFYIHYILLHFTWHRFTKPFNASCSKLLLFEMFSAILV